MKPEVGGGGREGKRAPGLRRAPARIGGEVARMTCTAAPAPLRRFLRGQGGAVTIDWVVTAAVVAGLGLATVGMVTVGVQSGAEATGDQLRGMKMNDRFREELADIQFLDGIDGFAPDGPGVLAHSDGPGSDGAPGFLHYTDAGGAGMVMAPEVLSGDLSGLYGGTIAFDMASFQGGGAATPAEVTPLVAMTTTGGTVLSLHSDYAPDEHGWSSAELRMRADAGWRIDGRVATEAEMRLALSDVAETRLRMQHVAGLPEQTGLDNLTVSTSGY